MAYEKGINFVISVGTNQIGGQRGATLNRTNTVLDVTTKDSNGWVENLPGGNEWSIEADGLVVVDDTGYAALESAFENGTIVSVALTNTVSDDRYEGQAIISEFPLEATYEDAATYTVTLTGTGALSKVEGGTP